MFFPLITYMITNLSFFSVVTGIVSSFLLFNSISFQKDSIVGDDFQTQMTLAFISLVNLCNGLYNQRYINRSQINFLGFLSILLLLATILFEIAYYDSLEYLGELINLMGICEDDLLYEM